MKSSDWAEWMGFQSKNWFQINLSNPRSYEIKAIGEAGWPSSIKDEFMLKILYLIQCQKLYDPMYSYMGNPWVPVFLEWLFSDLYHCDGHYPYGVDAYDAAILLMIMIFTVMMLTLRPLWFRLWLWPWYSECTRARTHENTSTYTSTCTSTRAAHTSTCTCTSTRAHEHVHEHIGLVLVLGLGLGLGLSLVLALALALVLALALS